PPVAAVIESQSVPQLVDGDHRDAVSDARAVGAVRLLQTTHRYQSASRVEVGQPEEEVVPGFVDVRVSNGDEGAPVRLPFQDPVQDEITAVLAAAWTKRGGRKAPTPTRNRNPGTKCAAN